MLKKLFPFIGSASLRWYVALTLLLVLIMAAEVFVLHVFATTEARLGDVYLRHHAEEYKVDPDIVVVDIDDASMLSMQRAAGLWAWKRETHGFLLEALTEFKPRAIVFDINFHERDLAFPKSDAFLSEQIKNLPHTYMQTLQLEPAVSNSETFLRDVMDVYGIEQSGTPDAKTPLQLPLAIQRDAWRLGLVNLLEDGDGVTRRYRLYSDIQGWHVPSLPARVVRDLGGSLPAGSDFQILWPQQGHKRYAYADLFLILTEQRPRLSAAAVAELHERFENKIVVIGSSAAGLYDHHLTPLGPRYPGVDMLAVAIDNLKNSRSISKISALWPLAGGLVLIAMLVMAFRKRRHPVLVGVVLALLSATAVYAADQMIAHHLMLPVATPLIFAWAWFLSAAVAGYLRERRTRDRTVSLFGRFLNPEVVRKIVDHGETVESLSGQTRQITVLFSDIRGFTTLSESKPPAEVVKLLNRYFERQVEVVWRHGGTLDKFIGDCIMAFWGAPLDDVDHARHAVAASLEMQENLIAFREELIADGSDLVNFDVGIGVHTGSAVVGFLGAKRKLDYTAIGDTVNLASRVEGLTKGVARVLVTSETMLACADSGFEFEWCGAFAVKGRAADVDLYEPKRKST